MYRPIVSLPVDVPRMTRIFSDTNAQVPSSLARLNVSLNPQQGFISTVYLVETDIGIMLDKVISREQDEDLEICKVCNEVAITKRMSDIGVAPQVHSIGFHPETVNILMERYDGRLRDLTNIYDVPDDVHELVDRMHDDRVVHRDLSLDNVVYRTRGVDQEYAIIDFGTAVMVEEITDQIRLADQIFDQFPTSKWRVLIDNEETLDWLL